VAAWVLTSGLNGRFSKKVVDKYHMLLLCYPGLLKYYIKTRTSTLLYLLQPGTILPGFFFLHRAT
jgi:hypothetical protein